MPKRTPEPDYTVKEVAATVNQTTHHVYQQIKAGVIPAYRIGKTIRIRREDVDVLRRPQPVDLDAYIERLVNEFPPLTPAQIDRVANILAGGGHRGD